MAAKQQTKQTESSTAALRQEHITAGIIALVSAIVYYIYSFTSVGYYQHDEIAHLINMHEFWQDPSKILGNWPKTGYKLIYAFPALLGSKFLTLFNCLVSGFTAYLAYRCAALFNTKYAILAPILLATQPMWIELSFRNYADSFSGFILLAAVFYHLKDKKIPAALLLSYSTLIRQEFFLIAIPYGIYLLIKQKWAPAFLLALFPLLYNLWGALLTGDYLYLYTSTKETSDLYSEQFGKHGFFHFFRMSMIVWGAVTVVLSVAFSASYFQSIREKQAAKLGLQQSWALIIPALIYLLIHSLFNYEGLKMGASPNLRYMNGIGPVLAVMASLAFYAFDSIKNKTLVYVSLAAVLLFYLIYASFSHNGVVLIEDVKDYKLWFFALLGAALLLIKTSVNNKIWLAAAFALISGLLPMQPKKLSNEDLAVQNLVKWMNKSKKTEVTFFCNHSVVPYFFDKITGGLPTQMKSLDSTQISQAPVGSLVIIESHYSLRKDFPAPAESIRNQYLETRDFNAALNNFIQMHQGTYQLAKEFIAKDQSFGAIVFEKVKE